MMKKFPALRIYLFISLVAFSMSLNGQIKGFNKVKWEREKIAPGLIWKSSHTFLDDTVPQNINFLLVNLHKRRISLLYNPKENTPVSKQADLANALAAVNAGFFNIREGGSVTYIRTGSLIVDSDTAKKWIRNLNMNGAFMIDSKGDIFIQSAMTNSWFDNHNEFINVLVTGPLLLKDKNKTKLPQTSLVINKHPRTAAGKIGKHKIILVTLDGRTDLARGMTLMDLADLMISLHCTDAVNLDGGGSTTMWIGGEPFNGVVSMPCDNRKFDHEGERAVSDILIIR
jgi:exopolysaccharide biosynthesis protein